ncbi:rolling circle replication-associated protein [Marasmitruncus massiliensis]|uniref:rolling circle replication-associated protein n=1 Tax=Marasmitruncus massiliensis TaxID=1944642 RepID=UPI000C7DDB6D|nr:hypothetical protein [Marasmitruncus massiliensis]
MTKKKYIIGKYCTTMIEYIYANTSARGGYNPADYFCKFRNPRMSDEEFKRLIDESKTADNFPIDQGGYYAENYIQRRRKRVATIKELITNNFNAHTSMNITLTFSNEILKKLAQNKINSKRSKKLDTASNIDSSVSTELPNKSKDFSSDFDATDVKKCNKLFKKFIQKMRYRYRDFQYVAVMAKQNSGNWHYHMICNLPYIDYKEFKNVWIYGGFHLKRFQKASDLCRFKNYIIKNMEKDSFEDLHGKKAYLASKNLKRNIVCCSWKNDLKSQELFQNVNREYSDLNNKEFVKQVKNKFQTSFLHYRYKVKSSRFPPCKRATKVKGLGDNH